MSDLEAGGDCAEYLCTLCMNNRAEEGEELCKACIEATEQEPSEDPNPTRAGDYGSGPAWNPDHGRRC